MNVKLDGVDPDDAFSSVPYEKGTRVLFNLSLNIRLIVAMIRRTTGYNFLFYLEKVVGGESLMNPFLRAHCDKFAVRRSVLSSTG